MLNEKSFRVHVSGGNENTVWKSGITILEKLILIITIPNFISIVILISYSNIIMIAHSLFGTKLGLAVFTFLMLLRFAGTDWKTSREGGQIC